MDSASLAVIQANPCIGSCGVLLTLNDNGQCNPAHADPFQGEGLSSVL